MQILSVQYGQAFNFESSTVEHAGERGMHLSLCAEKLMVSKLQLHVTNFFLWWTETGNHVIAN